MIDKKKLCQNETLKSVEYIFKFIPSDNYIKHNIAEKVLEILSDKDKAKKNLSSESFSIYSDIFLFVEHEEVDYKSITLDVIQWIEDFEDHPDNENSELVVIGFSISRNIEPEKIQTVYNEIFIPLVQKLDIETKPYFEIGVYKTFTKTVSYQLNVDF